MICNDFYLSKLIDDVASIPAISKISSSRIYETVSAVANHALFRHMTISFATKMAVSTFSAMSVTVTVEMLLLVGTALIASNLALFLITNLHREMGLEELQQGESAKSLKEINFKLFLDGFKKATPLDLCLDVLGCIPIVNKVVGAAETLLASIAFIYTGIKLIKMRRQEERDVERFVNLNRNAGPIILKMKDLVEEVSNTADMVEQREEEWRSMITQDKPRHESQVITDSQLQNLVAQRQDLIFQTCDWDAENDLLVNEYASIEDYRQKLRAMIKTNRLKICQESANSSYFFKHIIFGSMRHASLTLSMSLGMMELSYWTFCHLKTRFA
jgi:hypothetical protein